MLEGFKQRYRQDAPADPRPKGSTAPDAVDLGEFFLEFGGLSFGNGIYRVIHPLDFEAWQERVVLAFPAFAGRVTCFGYDWLGRAFALDAGRSEGGEKAVLMLEPGTGQALEIPGNLRTFHEAVLIEYAEAALAVEFYEQWIRSGGQPPAVGQCVGYKVPLFLGGADAIENLELSDLDVYWHLMGQLFFQVRR